VHDGLFLGHDFLHADDFLSTGMADFFRAVGVARGERADGLGGEFAPVLGRRRAGDGEDQVLVSRREAW
jgi:hypothetical protein